MTAQQAITPQMTRPEMDALVDGHYRAEETGDLEAIVDGFAPHAEHDVVGRPGDPLHGGDQIEDFYRALLAELRIERFEPVRRWYGDDHVVDVHIANLRKKIDVAEGPSFVRTVRGVGYRFGAT